MGMADRVAVMRDGRILQDDSPEAIYDDPVDTFVADFVGTMNLFRGRLAEMNGSAAVVQCDVGVRLMGLAPTTSVHTDAPVALAVRPERVGLRPATPGETGIESTPGGTRLNGRVVHRTFLGDHLAYRVQVEGIGVVEVRSARGLAASAQLFATGEEVTLEWSLDGARVIPDVGRATNGNGGASAPGKEGRNP